MPWRRRRYHAGYAFRIPVRYGNETQQYCLILRASFGTLLSERYFGREGKITYICRKWVERKSKIGYNQASREDLANRSALGWNPPVLGLGKGEM